MNFSPPRCIACARVSTDEQAKHGVSLSGQLEAGHKKAAELGGTVVATCVESGVSGSLYESRADLQKALRMVEAGEADVLIWYDLSRMSRDIINIETIDKRVKAAGGRLVFCTAHYEDTANGFLQRGIEGVVGQYQRLNTRELANKNRRRAVRMGKQTQRSVSPYGFHVVNDYDRVRGTHTAEQVGTYEQKPHEAKVVRRIFEMYASGESLREIAAQLQREGVPTPKGRKARRFVTPEGEEIVGSTGEAWLHNSIRAVMENTAHYGRPSFGKTRNVPDESRATKGGKLAFKRVSVPEEEWIWLECEPIVSKELWDACKARREKAQTLFAGSPRQKYTLTGLIRCPRCHRTMRASSRSRMFKSTEPKEPSYCCPWSTPHTNAARLVCWNKHFWGADIERQLIDVITEVVTRPEVMEAAYEAFQDSQKERFPEADYERLKGELAAVESRVQIAVEAQLKAIGAGIDASVYEKVLRDDSALRQRLRSDLARFEASRKKPAKHPQRGSNKNQFIAKTIGEIKKALCSPELQPSEKQRLLARIIESIYPLETGGIRVAFQVGTFEPNQRWIWENGAWIIQDVTGETNSSNGRAEALSE